MITSFLSSSCYKVHSLNLKEGNREGQKKTGKSFTAAHFLFNAACRLVLYVYVLFRGQPVKWNYVGNKNIDAGKDKSKKSPNEDDHKNQGDDDGDEDDDDDGRHQYICKQSFVICIHIQMF